VTPRRAARQIMPAPIRRRIRRLLGKRGTTARATTKARQPATTEIDRLYASIQSVEIADRTATDAELAALAGAWQDDTLPDLQRQVADVQLAELARGIVDPVFAALATALASVELPRFSLLDVACASGYYSEVIRRLDPRPIAYEGCDYSAAMVESARAHYPGVTFSVEDLTTLSKADRSYEVVLASGVLEHIPDYRAALAQATRVARDTLIIHRCPTVAAAVHVRTIGTQYRIETPRTFFSEDRLVAEVAELGFERVGSIDVYPGETGGEGRTLTRTFAFRRRLDA
jgi:putative methyltransferase (TIGR04325 family)